MECKLRCVNFRRVSHPRRAFLPAFRVTGTSDDWYRSTMGVIVGGLGTPRRTGETFGCTWEHLRAPATSLGAPMTSPGAPGSAGHEAGSAGDMSGSAGDIWRSTATSLGAPRNAVEQYGKNIFVGNTAHAPGNHSYYLSFNDY